MASLRLPYLIALLFLLSPALPAGPLALSFQEEDEEEVHEESAVADEEGDEEEGEDADEEEDEEDEKPVHSGLLSSLSFRGIGPCINSGRIGDLVVDPTDKARWIAAASSGGVWITENAGTTWKSVFDGQASYSIGCVTLDPNDPKTVWVGSGENNSQRSVSWGDGVYRSLDGGKSWKNMGLKETQHIGQIVVDPRDSNVVWVAAQGPLWNEGGERGLYKTSDGGKTWELKLEIDEHTGVNEVLLDPRNPDVMYASSYQRARRVWTLLNGGPGSGIHKSVDGGETWRELKSGIPSVDKGRIGLAISPADPDVIYAIIEAQQDKGGVFRSTNRGESWSKRSSYMSSSPQYYNELVPDPHDVDKLYSLNTYLMVTTDGGANFSRVPNRNRHVDDHALWIDPDKSGHMVVGCDGGVYETWDEGSNWRFCANLPLTQLYRLALDDAQPFYNVYGGTQDNNTLGGPTRTTDRAGITNPDWFVTVGGDGFEPAVEPGNPDIVYSQWQHGGLVRHDRSSGETVDIKPRQAVGELEAIWNWDSPLAISPHSPTRLYFAGNYLFRSEDRGETWGRISEDLSRGLDRDQLEVMGRVWEVDAVAKHRSTSIYGSAVAFSESPVVEDLLYVGTDDGLIHVSDNGGGSWTRYETFPDVPELTYVSCLFASPHDADKVYACFDAHKIGDFEPYVMVSHDRGASWTSIAEDLESPHVVYCLAEDPEVEGLLFIGTEYGAFTSLDAGETWHQLKGGLPTIAVRDLEIQPQFDDLVLATFGRGFYVLDDYSPLRGLAREPELTAEARIFPTRPALAYFERGRLGGRGGAGSLGASYYTAPNPEFGAVFTYQIKESIETKAAQRKKAQKEARKDEELATPIPTLEELRAERLELSPALLLVVRDAGGEVLGQVSGKAGKGLHRVAWDLRSTALDPIREGGGSEWASPMRGPMVLAGEYSVELVAVEDGMWRSLAGPAPFQVETLEQATFRAEDPLLAYAFLQKVERLRGAISGASRSLSEARDQLGILRRAAAATPGEDGPVMARVRVIELRLNELDMALNGDRLASSLQRPAPVSVSSRINTVAFRLRGNSGGPSADDEEAYRDAGEAFEPLLAELRQIVEGDIATLREELEAEGAPWTPGRLPIWTRD